MSSKKEKARHAGPGTEAVPAGSAAPVEGRAAEVATEPVPAAEELQKQLTEIQARAADLEQQLARSQSQVDEYKDGWQRALADFQNYKRRVDADAKDTYNNAVGTVVKRYLPILDDLERALAHRPADLPWADGIELIYRKLQTILENEGLKRIEAEGQPFDPNFHEAIGQEAVEGVESGMVIGVIQQGYVIGERVVRPALVRVAQ